MKVCKHCGEINLSDSAFCCNCGKDNFVFQEEQICPFCGVVNDKSFTFCISCGNDMTQTQEQSQTAVEGDSYVPVAVDVRQELSTGIPLASLNVPAETAKCPSCGCIVPLTAIFCPKCGASVASLHEHRVVQRRRCPHCGRPNALDAHMCSYCYSSLTQADTTEMQVVHNSEHLGEIVVRQTLLEDCYGKNVLCPNCGTLNQLDEAFCVSCGLKLVVEEPKKYCPDCGAEQPYDSGFCAVCGWSFEGAKPDGIEKWVCGNCQQPNDKQDTFCSNCGQKREI